MQSGSRLGWLITARMLQAVGGAMLNPVAMSIISNTFTDPRQRARAIGVWSGVVGLSMAAGPIIGGTLVESADRRATNPADRRSKPVHLTEEGQAAARVIDILTTPPDALLALPRRTSRHWTASWQGF